jgi:hypothetical protein
MFFVFCLCKKDTFGLIVCKRFAVHVRIPCSLNEHINYCKKKNVYTLLNKLKILKISKKGKKVPYVLGRVKISEFAKTEPHDVS